MKKTKIVTHSGAFHGDDVFAVLVILLTLAETLEKALASTTILRTRDPNDIQKGDFVVDVGGEYDPIRSLFDHHQSGGSGKRPNGIPYASAGLVWKTFGLKLVKQLAEKEEIDPLKLAAVVDRILVQGIDAFDSGEIVIEYLQRDSQEPVPVRANTLNTLAMKFNPDGLIETATADDFDRQFVEAIKAVEPFLKRAIITAAGRIKAETIVASCDQGGKVLVLDRQCPWGEVVIEDYPHVLFVILEDVDKTWTIQAVPTAQIDAREYRQEFPDEWGGLEGKDLSTVAGIPGCLFCHVGRFMARTKTKQAAVALAEKACLR